MAKVIGYEPKLLKKCVCSNCTAIIEYTPNEAKPKFYDNGKAATDEGRAIIGLYCPNCGDFIRTNH